MSNRKYDVMGRECEVIRKIKEGHVIRFMKEEQTGGDEWSEYPGDMEIFTGKLFSEPPSYKYTEEIKRGRKTRSELQKEIAETSKELASIKGKHQAMVKELKAVPNLENIVRFLRGEITHYVFTGYTEIKTFDEARTTCSDREFRMLFLAGGAGDSYDKVRENLTWRLSYYGDGSGGSVGVIPCTSLKEAAKYFTQRVLKEYAEWGSDFRSDIRGRFKEYKIKVPAELVMQFKADEREYRKEKTARRKREIIKLRGEIKELQKK